MTPSSLFTCLKSSGLTLTARDGRLWVSPPEKVTKELKGLIREHKKGLLELLVSLTSVEKFVVDMAPSAGAEVIVEAGPLGSLQYKSVPLAEWQAATREWSNND